MGNISIILTIVFVHLLAVISPGPDFIVAVRNSVNYGRKVGIFTAIGFGIGIIVHLVYCYLGIAILISSLPTLFATIKTLGALYILYLAYQIFQHRSSVTKVDANIEKTGHNLTSLQALKSGFLTNALNPKATLFFLGIFTTIIPTNVSISTLLICSFFLVVDTILWFTFVAYIFTQKKSIEIFQKYAVYVNTFLSVLLTLLSIKILLF